jgi:hypothetical protein
LHYHPNIFIRIATIIVGVSWEECSQLAKRRLDTQGE